jgi:hypothetical protein
MTASTQPKRRKIVSMKSDHTAIVGALTILTILVIAAPLATSKPLPVSMSVTVVGKSLQGPGDSAYVFAYITNNAPFSTIPFRGVRENVGNVVTIESIDSNLTVNNKKFVSFTQPVTTSITFASPYDTVSRVITSTSSPPYAGRFSPVVLPGETVAVYYGSWAVGCADPTGAYKWTFTVHAALNGSPIVLKGSGTFTVEHSSPPCVGVTVLNESGDAVVGAGIALGDLSTKSIVATGSTDSHGNCFFYASSVPLVTGHSYEVYVPYLPPPYTYVTPDTTYPPTFTWTGSTVYVLFTAS